MQEGGVAGPQHDGRAAVHERVIAAVLGVEPDCVGREEAVESSRENQVFGNAAFQSVLRREQPQAVGQYQSLFHVVGREKNRFPALLGQPVQQHHGLDAAGQVEKSGRLVEQYHIAFLCQGFGDEGFLPFAVGELREVGVAFVGNTCQRHDLFHAFAVVPVEPSEEPGVGIATQGDQFVHAQSTGHVLLGEDDPDALGPFPFGEG